MIMRRVTLRIRRGYYYYYFVILGISNPQHKQQYVHSDSRTLLYRTASPGNRFLDIGTPRPNLSIHTGSISRARTGMIDKLPYDGRLPLVHRMAEGDFHVHPLVRTRVELDNLCKRLTTMHDAPQSLESRMQDAVTDFTRRIMTLAMEDYQTATAAPYRPLYQGRMSFESRSLEEDTHQDPKRYSQLGPVRALNKNKPGKWKASFFVSSPLQAMTDNQLDDDAYTPPSSSVGHNCSVSLYKLDD